MPWGRWVVGRGALEAAGSELGRPAAGHEYPGYTRRLVDQACWLKPEDGERLQPLSPLRAP